MGKHSEHCDDIACLGCECEPECDDCDCGVSRDYYAGMTEGRIQERERIIALLKTIGFSGEWIRRDYVIALISEETE
jgi:hypothetical protein